jgi:type I restriction enzyme R subunit
MSPEEQARQIIDQLLTAAGWTAQDFKAADIHAARGVAIREFVLDAGQGFADYLLYAEGRAAGVIEAKKQGATLTGVEIQSARYAQGLPAGPPGAARFPSYTRAPAPRPTSPTRSTPSRAPATSSPFISPRHWLIG